MLRRVACGLVVENWVVTDRLSGCQQRGVITAGKLASVGTRTAAPPAP